MSANNAAILIRCPVSDDDKQRCEIAGVLHVGAHLARGCTSGQALTGGALLNVGSWAFMLMVFVGGYSVAWFMRWQWR
mgnify:CR=1 FL=1